MLTKLNYTNIMFMKAIAIFKIMQFHLTLYKQDHRLFAIREVISMYVCINESRRSHPS